MSRLLLCLSRAVTNGRAPASGPPSREALLVTLLNKRAVAYNMGATELEAMLRQQILWSLPTYDGEGRAISSNLASNRSRSPARERIAA